MNIHDEELVQLILKNPELRVIRIVDPTELEGIDIPEPLLIREVEIKPVYMDDLNQKFYHGNQEKEFKRDLQDRHYGATKLEILQLISRAKIKAIVVVLY